MGHGLLPVPDPPAHSARSISRSRLACEQEMIMVACGTGDHPPSPQAEAVV